MKKLIILPLLAVTFLFFGNQAKAQTYQNSVGLNIDFGDGSTLVGPAIKHFFNKHDAIQGELMFGNSATFIGGTYQYNAPVEGAKGLNWYLGAGAMAGFGNGDSAFYIRPVAGLDYKLKDVPFDLAFDWRPTFQVSDGSEFTAARFGLGLRFTF